MGVLLVVWLLTRRAGPTRLGRRWWAVAAGAAALGGLAAYVVLRLAEGRLQWLPTPLLGEARPWVYAGAASLALALTGLWRSSWPRKAAALGAGLALIVVAGLGVNAAYGLTPTLGAVLGHLPEDPIDLPNLARPMPAPTHNAVSNQATGPLWKTWSPPADLPATGQTGSVPIPGAVSGFNARPAGLYLPPAALVPNPPALPVVVMLMGQPGNPDPQFAAAAADRLAATNRGLAPIVVVADQLGDPLVDTLCLDTPQYGNVQTYVNTDVVEWIKANLNVSHDRRDWTIAGSSHGGQCAASFVARYPAIWGSSLAIAPEEYPGAENPAKHLAEVFGGDEAAYAATHPIAIMSNNRYPDTTAIWADAVDDFEFYQVATKRLHAAALAAGMASTLVELPSGGHGVGVINGGLDAGFRLLYPRWGLSRAALPPVTTAPGHS